MVRSPFLLSHLLRCFITFLLLFFSTRHLNIVGVVVFLDKLVVPPKSLLNSGSFLKRGGKNIAQLVQFQVIGCEAFAFEGFKLF